MTTPPPEPGDDPRLPARLRANGIIRDGEQAVGRAWFRALTRWMDRVRPAVLPEGGAPNPGQVNQFVPFWGTLVDDEVMPPVRGILSRVWRAVTDATPDPLTDPAVADYLNVVGNRLRGVPDEVYSRIVREAELGLAEGESIDEIANRIRPVLTASGTDLWPNRATTVARTETIGAVNAGAYFAAVRDAEQRGDPAPFKVWLATEDARTRPTHRAADGQRTLVSEPFRVGGASLQFPGDPTGPAQEVINCRCTFLPVVLGEELDWTDRGWS